ncbi:MAG: carboxymuconolactone decarboxylase family protein [Polyangiaceae bacterium]
MAANVAFIMLLVDPPARPPWFLRPALWLARRMTGKDPLPGRLLAHFPKAAIAGGVLEALSAHGPGDLEARVLKLARLAASVTTGCPFCVDMNAGGHDAAGVSRADVDALLAGEDLAHAAPRERAAVALARALSATPIEVSPELRATLREVFSPREIVTLASTVAQVNYWARLNQALGVPAAGFFEGCVPD